MVTREEIRAAVDDAKGILTRYGIDVDTTVDDLIDWFDAELPFPDIDLGDVVVDPLLVVHELVEIDEMLKMGFLLTKDVIMKNPRQVDDAHLKAAEIEMKIAHNLGAIEHLSDRVKDIEKWCIDKTLEERRRADYRRLLARTKEYLSEIDRQSE